jgi:hypothetical protein
MRKSGIWNAFDQIKEGTESKRQEAHRKYKVAKKNAVVWQDEFMVTLVEARAERNHTTFEKEYALLRRVANQKTQGRNVKRMLKK